MNAFIERTQLTPIPNESNFSRQGGPKYTHTSLINGIYIPKTHYNQYQCHTNTQLYLNSDHFLVTLKLLPNFLIRQPPIRQTDPPPPPPQYIYPILETNMNAFLIKFNKLNHMNILQLTNFLKANVLLPHD